MKHPHLLSRKSFIFVLQEQGSFVETVLLCEELSGGYSQEMMEVGFSGLFFYHYPTTTQVNILKIVPVMIV